MNQQHLNFSPTNNLARVNYLARNAIRSLEVISLLSMQKNWLRTSSLSKTTERSDINSASGGSIFILQFSIPACPG
jgi:hypothetical protein